MKEFPIENLCKPYIYRVGIINWPVFEKLYLGDRFIFFKSIKTTVQNNVKIDYLSKFKAGKRKLKPTDDFEKEPNFTPVFLKNWKFTPFWKYDFRKTVIHMTLTLFGNEWWHEHLSFTGFHIISIQIFIELLNFQKMR